MQLYTYIAVRSYPPMIEEFPSRKEAEHFVRTIGGDWEIGRHRAIHQYCVSYEYSHGKYNTSHSERVFAENAKAACRKVMEKYYDNLNALYARRGTIKNAAAHGVRYPFHLHAELME